MIRVVVAGDIRLYRDGLALHLARQTGITVAACVASASELLRILSEIRPDVVLLDMAMQESLQVIRAARAAVADVRIVALAVPDIEPAVLACAEAGVTGYVTRDASLEDLVATIELAARGECVMSPRMAGSLLRRLSLLATGRGDGAFPTKAALTARELEIAALVDQGMSNKSIAGRLGIEVATVKNHVHHILAKLRAERRAEIPRLLRATRTDPALERG